MIDISQLKDLLPSLVWPFVVGYVLWKIGDGAEKRRIKADSIRELMVYRGDLGSNEFRRALNRVSIVFSDDKEIRLDIRSLYERINTSPDSSMTRRSIVSLIYKLCQKNGFKGLSEYDIDQAFPENKQAPDPVSNEMMGISRQENAKPKTSKRNKKK